MIFQNVAKIEIFWNFGSNGVKEKLIPIDTMSGIGGNIFGGGGVANTVGDGGIVG